MGVHAEVGADGGLHVLRPVESGGINHPLHARGPGPPHLQCHVTHLTAFRAAHGRQHGIRFPRLRGARAFVFPSARFCFFTRFRMQSSFRSSDCRAHHIQSFSGSIQTRWIRAEMMEHSGCLRVDSPRARAYTQAVVVGPEIEARYRCAHLRRSWCYWRGWFSFQRLPWRRPSSRDRKRFVRRRASRSHRRSVQPGVDRESSHGRHRWHRAVPRRGPAARDLYGHLVPDRVQHVQARRDRADRVVHRDDQRRSQGRRASPKRSR